MHICVTSSEEVGGGGCKITIFFPFSYLKGVGKIPIIIHDTVSCMKCMVECTPIKVLQLVCWSMTSVGR